MTAGASREDAVGMHCTKKPHRPPLAAILVVPLIAALVLTLFAWPSAKVGPRDLPVGVVGPPRSSSWPPASFEVHRYADEAAAREAIEDREIYGAFVHRGPKVLAASAASPAVAQMLTHAAEARPVEDVVPATPASNALGRLRAAARARRHPHRRPSAAMLGGGVLAPRRRCVVTGSVLTGLAAR